MSRPPPILDLTGSPRERGRAHGEARRDGVRGHFESWRASLAGRRADTRGYIDALLNDTDFETAARRLTPGLLDEIEGVAEGAAMDRRDVYALQLIDEEWAYAVSSADKCSSFGLLDDDGRAWLGQTMDLPAHTDGFQLLLRHGAGGGAQRRRIFTLDGVVALMGLAETHGVCVNTLSQVPAARSGLPVAFVVRGMLDAPHFDAAVAFAEAAPHASGQHYVIAGPGRIASIEASAAGVERLADGGVLHTNHPLAASGTWGENSTTRLASLTSDLGGRTPTAGVIEAALCNRTGVHPVCRERRGQPGETFTTGAMYASFVDLGPDLARFTAGPPSTGGFTDVA